MEENTKENQEMNPKRKNTMMYAGIAAAVVLIFGGYLLFTKSKSSTQPQTLGSEQQSMTNETVEEDTNSSDSMAENESMETTLDDESMEDGEMMEESNADVINVEGGSFYFKPNEIRVKAGETVRVILQNAGGRHDFVIDELDVRTPVTQTGETAEVTFTPTDPGEYEFYCSVANHRELGMVGTLIVE